MIFFKPWNIRKVSVFPVATFAAGIFASLTELWGFPLHLIAISTCWQPCGGSCRSILIATYFIVSDGEKSGIYRLWSFLLPYTVHEPHFPTLSSEWLYTPIRERGKWFMWCLTPEYVWSRSLRCGTVKGNRPWFVQRLAQFLQWALCCYSILTVGHSLNCTQYFVPALSVLLLGLFRNYSFP